MSAKGFFSFCAVALLAQMSLAATIGSSFGSGLTSSGFGSSSFGSGLLSSGSLSTGISSSSTGQGLAVSSGGPLLVTAISPIGPSGLAVASENLIEGVLTVNGQLPYLSAVAFEGALPTSGSGAATCGCGSTNNVGMISEGFSNRGRGFSF